MIDWRKLKFPDEKASANELHTLLSDFLREGLEATEVGAKASLFDPEATGIESTQLECDGRSDSVRACEGCRRAKSNLLECSVTANPSQRA